MADVPTIAPIAPGQPARPANMSPATYTKLQETAQSFEAQFIGQMFQMVTDSMEVDPVFGGGAGEKMFRGMMVDTWAESASKQGGLGISNSVMRELIQQQEGTN